MAGLFDWMRSSSGAMKRALRLVEQGRRAEAFPLFAKAAEAKLPEAEFQVARCYLEGAGVPASSIEGARWLERAATQGYVEAQSMLAAMYVHGIPGSAAPGALGQASELSAGRPAAVLFAQDEPARPDFGRAAVWARKAAESGSADGQALLAFILTSGPEEGRDLDAAEELYRRSAAADCPQGRLGLGLALLRKAAAVPELFAEAASQLGGAAEAGLPTAQYLLGVLCEQGQGVEKDPARGVAFYKTAAEKGLRSAQARLGMALMEGRGVEKDTLAGESWLRRAALGGDPEAAALVGDMYARGGDLPPNHAEAAMWFRLAADAGHRMAARALGMLHLTGAGVPRDPSEATRWFRISAEAGDIRAKHDLAALVLQGQGTPEDSVRTREWFEQAAASDDLVAAFNYGVCLAQGVGVERDDRRAAEWLRKAAEGVVNAQYWYGRMLIEGRGVTQDLAEGRRRIALAADTGMTEAQVALAEMMVNGRGGPKDHPAALALFQLAAESGHAGAMFAIGALYGGGHDIPWDRPQAQRWFRMAAERGHVHAQMMLGRYLARGLAGQTNFAEARSWLERAAAQGLADAQADLAALLIHAPDMPAPAAPNSESAGSTVVAEGRADASHAGAGAR